MTPSSADGLAWSLPVLSLGLDLAARATAMLAIALLIALALRRRASLASAVGHAAVIGLLLLPFSTLVLPPMPITCLPGGSGTSGPGTTPEPVPHIPDAQDGADRIAEAARTEPVVPASEVSAPSPIAEIPPASSAGGAPALTTARAMDADGVPSATSPN